MGDEREQHADADDGVPAIWNPITRSVIGCAMEVHRRLGRGLPEKHYEEALCYELSRIGLNFQRQVTVRAFYKDIALPELRLDLLVEEGVVVELKVLDKVPDVALAQLVSYLKATRLPIGLLINFNAPVLKEGIYRRINEHAAPTPRPTPQTGDTQFAHDFVTESHHSAFSATSALKKS